MRSEKGITESSFHVGLIYNALHHQRTTIPYRPCCPCRASSHQLPQGPSFSNRPTCVCGYRVYPVFDSYRYRAVRAQQGRRASKVSGDKYWCIVAVIYNNSHHPSSLVPRSSWPFFFLAPSQMLSSAPVPPPCFPQGRVRAPLSPLYIVSLLWLQSRARYRGYHEGQYCVFSSLLMARFTVSWSLKYCTIVHLKHLPPPAQPSCYVFPTPLLPAPNVTLHYSRGSCRILTQFFSKVASCVAVAAPGPFIAATCTCVAPFPPPCSPSYLDVVALPLGCDRHRRVAPHVTAGGRLRPLPLARTQGSPEAPTTHPLWVSDASGKPHWQAFKFKLLSCVPQPDSLRECATSGVTLT